MADHNYQHIVRNNNQKQHDFANDTFEPRNRFCPTDLGLISCFLEPKFKTGKKNFGKGWFYEKLNVYDYSPDDLTEEYESCDNKWYFLTLRERKHLTGNRSHRHMRNLGTWKATEKDTMVCDQVTQRVLGRKRCLVYLDNNKHKNKMADWVLCKIYKKEASINLPNRVQNVHVGSSQTLPATSINTSTHSNTMQPMPVFCGSNVTTQTAIQDISRDLEKQVQPSIGSSTCEYYDNKSRQGVTQGFQFSSGASSSSSMVVPRKVDVYTHVAQLDDFKTCPAQESTAQMDTVQPMASSQSYKDEIPEQDV